MNTLEIAKLCHEINRLYCRATGDNSQPSWGDAPGWQKMSAINGAKLHLENPNLDDSASHEAWLAEKKADGWKYGPEKDIIRKRHPCCIPFEDLPTDQKVKDTLFRSVVRALAPLWEED